MFSPFASSNGRWFNFLPCRNLTLQLRDDGKTVALRKQFRGFTSSGDSRHTNPLVFLRGAAACLLLLITYDVILRAFKV
ncbi:hypothetical protein QQF64_018652 [Cirrhinus molitorella]|uniref:Uncharacterized protein n=1 Tax=Cirrhinus molitorella TaxID=172907 RepID=A0ABR3LFV8_9TELE